MGPGASECAEPCAGSAIQVYDLPALAHALAARRGHAARRLCATFVALFARSGARAPSPGGCWVVGWLLAVWGAPLAVGLVAVAVDPEPGTLIPYLRPR